MSQIRYFTDEDIFAVVAPQLRSSGYDAVSTPEANRLGETDESQLEWATAQARILVTFNVGHFARLHSDWIGQGKHHHGVIVSDQRPVGDLLRRLKSLARSLSAEDMEDRLEYLSNW